MVEDFERCYRALQSRDPRFDGWFVTAVTTTGVYCRPSCPARTPLPGHVRFLPTAAAAQAMGFRACLRCRPDAAPGSPEWNARQDTVGRAMRMIADGVVDRHGVAGLARLLGYGPRQLHRLLVAEVGAGPLALARTQRANAARLLIETTELPMADVAFAAGFASVRQFNDTVQAAFGRTPSALRRRRAAASQARQGRTSTRACPRNAGVPGAIALRLPYRRPMALEEMIAFLAHRAVPGVEVACAGAYRRTLRLPHGHGTVTIEPGADHVRARLVLEDLRDLGAAVGRCRRLLDLDADPEAVDAALAEDPLLRPLVARNPGRRVPGTVDGFELAVRAVIGQQVSTAGARTVAARLVAAAGPALRAAGAMRLDPSAVAPSAIDPSAVAPSAIDPSAVAPSAIDPSAVAPTAVEPADVEPGAPGRVFPSPEEVLDAPDTAFAMPASRRRALRALAAAVADGSLVLDAGADSGAVRNGLGRMAGIGEWTVAYVSMRALGDPDAFLAGDLGIRRAFAHLGLPDDQASVTARAARWRPWRAYAMTQLWAVDTSTPTGTAAAGSTPTGGTDASGTHEEGTEDAA